MRSIKHEGLHKNRLHPNGGNPLERVYARQWESLNRLQTGRPTPVLAHLVGDFTQRDANVAATVVQWLGSNVGDSFLAEVRKEYAQLVIAEALQSKEAKPCEPSR